MSNKSATIARGSGRQMNGFQASLCLLCVTLCWSTETIIFAAIPDSVSSFATTCISAFIGATLLLLVFNRRIVSALRADRLRLIRHCVVLGVLNFVLNIGYIEGLRYLNVATGAFGCIATAVFVPLLLLAFRRKVSTITWISAGLIAVGVTLVISNTAEPEDFRGLVILAGACLVNACYIVKLGDYAREHDPFAVAALYLVVVCLVSFVAWWFVDPGVVFTFAWTPRTVACLFLHGYFITAFATVVNTFANARTTADSAAIVYSIEIVFTVSWGALLPATIIEPLTLTPVIVVGCAFVVAGNVISVARALFTSLRKERSGT